MDEFEIVIIGAGLSGLAAANYLVSQGKKVGVFEALNQVGGKVSTEKYQGFTLDKGFQVLLDGYPESKKQLDYQSLNLNRFRRGAMLRYKGRFLSLDDPFRNPFNPFSLVKAGWMASSDLWSLGKLYWRLFATPAQTLMEKPGKTALEVLRSNHFSEDLIDHFFRPFLGGILLDQTLNCPGSLVDYVLKMFMQGYACLPADGMQAIPEQLAAKLSSEVMFFSHKAAKIEDHQVYFSNGKKVQAKHIILATDYWSAAKILDLPNPKPGREVGCWYFSSSQAPYKDRALMLNCEGKGVVNHIVVLNEIAPSYAPKGQFLISVSVLENHLTSSDEVIEGKIRKQMQEWFGQQVLNWNFLKSYRIKNAHPSTYPIRDLPSHIHFAGDYLETPSIQSALATGRQAAEKVIAIF